MGTTTTKKQPKPKRYRTKSITKAKALFIYFIFAGIVSVIYAVSCLFTGFSYWYAAIPYSLLIIYGLSIFVWKNWKMIWVFVQNVERGRVLVLLTNKSILEFNQRIELAEWIYPKRNQIRKERWQELGRKLLTEGLTESEKKEINKKHVVCPQVMMDGVIKLTLVDFLIYAHENIQVLDDELREIMELSDEHIFSFDYDKEVAKIESKLKNHA